MIKTTLKIIRPYKEEGRMKKKDAHKKYDMASEIHRNEHLEWMLINSGGLNQSGLDGNHNTKKKWCNRLWWGLGQSGSKSTCRI